MPLPLPLAPEVMSSQPTLSDALQLQPAGALTKTLPVPPVFEKSRPSGVMVTVQEAGPWVIVWVRPATVIMALRSVAAVFGSTV